MSVKVGTLPTLISKPSFMAIQSAIAYFEEQSIRILPSLSNGIKAKLASTTSLTTFILRSYAEQSPANNQYLSRQAGQHQWIHQL